MSGTTIEQYLERKELWVQALKSGEYVQGEGNLRTEEDGYCCLGVACDVYHKVTGLGQWLVVGDWEEAPSEEWRKYDEDEGAVEPRWVTPSGDVVEPGAWVFSDKDTELPDEVMKWFGIRTVGGSPYCLHNMEFSCPRRPDGRETVKHSSLITANDGHVDFQSIATVIDSEPLGLFTWRTEEEEDLT